MRLQVRIEGEAGPGLRRFARDRLPRDRRELVEDIQRDALAEIIAGNPVDTGRSRAGWVQSLEQLGGTPPPGWQGRDASAMSQGRRQSRLTGSETSDVTELAAANGAAYLPFLEYGTQRQPPFAMVRRALAVVAQRLRQLRRG